MPVVGYCSGIGSSVYTFDLFLGERTTATMEFKKIKFIYKKKVFKEIVTFCVGFDEANSSYLHCLGSHIKYVFIMRVKNIFARTITQIEMYLSLRIYFKQMKGETDERVLRYKNQFYKSKIPFPSTPSNISVKPFCTHC